MNDALGECDGEVPAKARCVDEFDIQDVLTVPVTSCDAYAAELNARLTDFVGECWAGPASAFCPVPGATFVPHTPVQCLGDVLTVSGAAGSADCDHTLGFLHGFIENYVHERLNFIPGVNSCDSSTEE